MVITPRLRLIPATPELTRAEIADRELFSRYLGALVPDNWPPETLADALQFFLTLLEANPGWCGWLVWYAVTLQPDEASILVGSVGFKGPPDRNGLVEIGYSVLPQFQGKGYATEMAKALVGWARDSGQVRAVMAQTADDNTGSQRVLTNLGFVAIGAGDDANSTLHRLSFPATGGG